MIVSNGNQTPNGARTVTKADGKQEVLKRIAKNRAILGSYKADFMRAAHGLNRSRMAWIASRVLSGIDFRGCAKGHIADCLARGIYSGSYGDSRGWRRSLYSGPVENAEPRRRRIVRALEAMPRKGDDFRTSDVWIAAGREVRA